MPPITSLHRKDTAEQLDDLLDQVEEQALLTVILQNAYEPMLRAIHEAVRAALPSSLAESFRLDDAATRIILAEAASRVVRIDETTRNAIREVLQEGQALGLSSWEIANGKPSIGFGGIDALFRERWKNRALTVARTELQHAQNVASVNRYTATGIIDRVEIVDGDYDDFCAARNGKIVPLSQAPGLAHPNCLIGDQMVLAPNTVGSSVRNFEGEVVVLRTADDDLITCTPNHPILSPFGWKVAGDFREGDCVIRCSDSQRMASLLDPDHQYRPAAIQQVAGAFGPSGGVTASRVPVTAKDFHGDGIEGDICVVRTNGLSRSCMFRQKRQQFSLSGALIGQRPFFSQGSPAEVVEGSFHSSDRRMRSSSVGHSLLGCHAGVAQSNGFTHGAERPAAKSPRSVNGREQYASVSADLRQGLSRQIAVIERPVDERVSDLLRFQASSDGESQPVKRFSKSLLFDAGGGANVSEALTGLVKTTRINQIVRRQFSGHVYNLQTEQGWYIAENIITHNCTLALIPLLREGIVA